MPESYTRYISRIEDANYASCKAEREKFGVTDPEKTGEDCTDKLACFKTCPFLRKAKGG